jgi:hypothetical protein
MCQKVFSMPFRATNDALHKQEAPITLDFLIPGGSHIDDKMTIGQVIRIRFEKPKGRMNNFIKEVSEHIPFKYRFHFSVSHFFSNIHLDAIHASSHH